MNPFESFAPSLGGSTSTGGSAANGGFRFSFGSGANSGGGSAVASIIALAVVGIIGLALILRR